MHDYSKSLEQLEGFSWGPMPADPSNIVRTCFHARKVAIGALSVEQLRMLLGQDIGATFLFDRAVGILEADLLVQGSHYFGDLFCNVLRLNPEIYRNNPNRCQRVEKLIALLPEALTKLEDKIDWDCSSEAVGEAIARYRKGLSGV